ncbi:hypothetical protein CWR48_12175 [Oceanobacillus arenosus]|uniref:Uncharacterized protein n=1 Tax=Oceanobacillus arenosus TaxID=1229153 RepID=A0A3D8PSS2_9BACI|nr:hypothetical protein [Oceanobacillus arenosus]RDW18331.1 hypothetical protein CWR48_12175 [Oceanobacillus arenosus]
MNNRQGVMTALITTAAAGAAIYGITRGVQNGTFQRLPGQLSNAMNNPAVQQLTNTLGSSNTQQQNENNINNAF